MEANYTEEGLQWAPDDTELQYYQEYEQQQAALLQQSLRLQSLGWSYGQSQNLNYSYSTAAAPGQYEGLVLPENVATVGVHDLAGEGGVQQSQRSAEAAVVSWRVGRAPSNSVASGLSLSEARASEFDLKDFLAQRGNHILEGLHRAAAQGDRAGIMHILKMQGPEAPLNQPDGSGCTPLMYATLADSRLAIEMLLNFSARREQTDSEGRTAVHYAAFFGKHRSLKFLIEAASDWTPRDVYGRTPLHWSCMPRTTRCLTVLLKHASVVMGDINPRDNEGMTPLHCAAHFSRPKHISLLCEADCDLTAVDNEGKTALHWTLLNPDSSCIQALVDAYPPLLNKRDTSNCTILHLTAANGSTHLVDALLRIEGLELDAKDNLERTALHYACIEGHSEIARLLLNYRALDSCIDYNGLTALHYAVETNVIDTLKAFAGLTDMTHLPDNEGRTPLMMATISGADMAVEVLVKNPVIRKTIDHVDGNGRSALHLAAQAGSAGCVGALLTSGADPNLSDNFQQTPLFPACEGGFEECIQNLISGGCQPDTFDIDSQAPLHKAVMFNQLGSVRALVVSGVNLNITDDNGNTALHMAAYGGSDGMVTLLLEHSANPNLQDSNGLSPVHLAAMEGHANCLASLIAFRAYLNFMDFSEQSLTPVDYAQMNGHDECVEVLTQAGGVPTNSIRDMAAITIQTVYRGYRARVLRSELVVKSKAVTVIAAHVRGFIQRQKFLELKKRHHAATLLQTHFRGYIQRCRFQKLLAVYREKRHHRELLETYHEMVERDKEASILQTFTSGTLEPERTEDDESLEESKARYAREQKLRLEAAMKMRERYLEKQQRWKEFRDAERQRRINKCNQEQLDYFASVIADSKARREYTTSRFQSTRTIRSHYDAAVIIQRRYRQWKKEQVKMKRESLWRERQRKKEEERAAIVIQKAWREYQQHKLYKALHFKSIRTSPVIALRDKAHRSTDNAGQLHSYEQNISITGNPRRKLHETEQSGFKVFRPATRDLLWKPDTLSHGKILHSSRPTSILNSPSKRSSNRNTPKPFGDGIGVGGSSRKMGHTFSPKKTGSHLFPSLLPLSQTSRTDRTPSKSTVVRLPEIVHL